MGLEPLVSRFATEKKAKAKKRTGRFKKRGGGGWWWWVMPQNEYSKAGVDLGWPDWPDSVFDQSLPLLLFFFHHNIYICILNLLMLPVLSIDRCKPLAIVTMYSCKEQEKEEKRKEKNISRYFVYIDIA